MQSIIKIGSRESRLAVRQAEIVKEAVESSCPGVKAEIVTMKTKGDRILNQSLELIGGKGLFVKELEKALLEGSIDICVHSLKDMPMEVLEDLPIVAYGEREDPRDVLVYKPGHTSVREGGVIGTSSRRRTLQMKKLYPSCEFRGIRGNVQTRLRRLEEEAFDGTVLAAAGLRRLHMEAVIGRVFSVEEVVPAAGQGILAVQGRKGEDYSWLAAYDCKKSRGEAEAERAFTAALGGGCTSPIAAHAQLAGTELRLTGLYYAGEDTYWTQTKTGDAGKAREIGLALAEEMRRR